MKVSIIVPVYNSAAYLKLCIESVLRQTYTDFELLLIADGPTDGSEKICQGYAKRDPRISCLLQAHKGVSAARNLGIEKAAGEYLFFLDSDDAIHPQLIEKLLKLAEETKAAIMAENFCDLPSKCFERKVSGMMLSEGEFSGGKCCYLKYQKALQYLLFCNPQGQMYAIGGKMIRKDVVRKFEFDKRMSNGEDTKFLYQLLAGGYDVAILCEDWYYYRKYRKNLSNMQIAEAYKSMFACNKYIWFQEKKEGRRENAQRWAEASLKIIAAWHVKARMKRNRELIRYTLKLAKEGKNYLEIEQTDWKVILECQMAFRCWPAYKCCCIMCNLWKRLKNMRKSGKEIIV